MGGRAPGGEASPPARFRNDRRHPDRPHAVALRGAPAAVDLGQSSRRTGSLQPRPFPALVTRVFERGREGDHAFGHRPFLASVRPARAMLASHRRGSQPRVQPRGSEKVTSVSFSRRGSSVRSRCARAKRVCCRYRRASPGPETRVNRSLPNRTPIHARRGLARGERNESVERLSRHGSRERRSDDNLLVGGKATRR